MSVLTRSDVGFINNGLCTFPTLFIGGSVYLQQRSREIHKDEPELQPVNDVDVYHLDGRTQCVYFERLASNSCKALDGTIDPDDVKNGGYGDKRLWSHDCSHVQMHFTADTCTNQHTLRGYDT